MCDSCSLVILDDDEIADWFISGTYPASKMRPTAFLERFGATISMPSTVLF